MSRSPGQLLIALVNDAAAAALASHTYRDLTVDRARFASDNRQTLLLLLARLPALRAQLAARYADERATDHPLLADLLSADAKRSEAAAQRLADDPTALTASATADQSQPPRPHHERTKPPDTAQAPAAERADPRRAARLQKALEHARKSRDQARGQLDYAKRELAETCRERDTAIGDRDEALTVIEALRAELAAERVRAAHLADDVTHAATVLTRALRPPAELGPEPEESDPRERDRRPDRDETEEEESQPVETHAPDGPVTRAIITAGLTVEAFLATLDAITDPPRPPIAVPVPVATTHSRAITVTPLGGGTEIGGSCILVEAGDARILVDAGSRPNQPLSRIGPPDIGVALADDLDAVVITHAHNDHAGFVPALTSRYPYLDVFCTADTAALVPTMWTDSVRVFDRTRRLHAKYGAPSDDLPYTQAHVAAARQRIRELACGHPVEVVNGVTVELFPAGHILGAAGVVITAGSSRVTVTGDVSNLAQASVSGLVIPEAARHSDLLVIESTYCRPGSPPRTSEVERFVTTVEETVNGGGRVLVPAFALGRAQEVVLTLRDRLPDVPVLIDGLAKDISRIYEQQTADTNHPLRIYGEQVREVRPGTRREQYTAMRRGGVIVTTSGMLTGGPAVTWARWILPDPSAALLVSGYQDEESAGAELLRLADSRTSTFLVDGEPVEVKANVAKFGLSAHADHTGLTSIIDEISSRQVMLVHGNAPAQRQFATHLRRRGHSVASTGEWTNPLPGRRGSASPGDTD